MPTRPAANETEVAERLIHTLSEDGFHLTGWCAQPNLGKSGKQPVAKSATQSATKSAIVWVHGLHLRFSEPEYCQIGRLVAQKGVGFYSVETRGHDFGTWLRGPGGTRLAGSAWEMFSECTSDLGAWLGRAREDGYERVVLAGHGYGAAKVVFHMAERNERDVLGIVVASSGSLVRDTIEPDRLAVAQQMMDDGRGLDLMPWGTRHGSLQSTVSAQVYLSRARVHRDLYGFEDMPPALARVGCPVLAWFGDQEMKNQNGRNPEVFLDTMRRNAVRSPLVETRILRNASYLYSGAESTVAKELLRWLGRIQAD